MKKISKAKVGTKHDFFPFFKVLENGEIERYVPFEKTPARDDPITGVKSKDVVITLDPPLSARMFIPKINSNQTTTKFPVLVYFHGGGFSTRSAFDLLYHNYAASLAHKANVMVVSVEYRLAPENPMPACYDDAFSVLKWVESNGHDNEPWLINHGDFAHFFIGGDSSGANMAYNAAVRVGPCGLGRLRLEGMILVHPYFMGTKHDKLWLYCCPENNGLEDARISPSKEDLGRIGFGRTLICVAEKDHFRDLGISFYNLLQNYHGKTDFVSSQGVGHTFHLFNPNCDQALFLMNRTVSFIRNHISKI